MLSFMVHTALDPLNVLTHEQIKDPVTVRTAEPAVLHKIAVCRMAGGTYDLIQPRILLFRFLPGQTEEIGQQLSDGIIRIKHGRIMAKIHFSGTLTAKIMLRLYAIDHLGVANIRFPCPAFLTQHHSILL